MGSNSYRNVIVQIVSLLLAAQVCEADGVASSDITELVVSYGHGEPVQQPVHAVLLVNHFAKHRHLVFLIRFTAQDGALFILFHVQLKKHRLRLEISNSTNISCLVRRVCRRVAGQTPAHVVRSGVRVLALAEREVVVVIRNLRLSGGDLVRFQVDLHKTIEWSTVVGDRY